MRIINGHDYYDSAQAYGHDPKVVFVRGEETLGEENFKRPHSDVYFVQPDKVKNQYHWPHKVEQIETRDGTWFFYNVRVIFCGVLYSGLKSEFLPHSGSDSKRTEYFWNREHFTNWVNDEFEGKWVPIFKEHWLHFGNNNECLTSKRITGDEHDRLIKNRISIAIFEPVNKKWVINCTGLKERQFYRVFDAVKAFQELDMWMSGALGMPGNPMLEVSDDVRMAKHGMDKWSFRKKVR
jgi:hypothetical protein